MFGFTVHFFLRFLRVSVRGLWWELVDAFVCPSRRYGVRATLVAAWNDFLFACSVHCRVLASKRRLASRWRSIRKQRRASERRS